MEFTAYREPNTILKSCSPLHSEHEGADVAVPIVVWKQLRVCGVTDQYKYNEFTPPPNTSHPTGPPFFEREETWV